jgi:putative inorganic carbon (hco3(-)) transporter
MLFRSDHFAGGHRLPDLLLLLLVAAGVTLGLAIGVENWRLLGAICGLFLLLVWPVKTAVGVYAFLIPWEDLAVVGHGADQTTLLWYAGGIALVVLVGVGSIRRCIVRPPRAALFWSLLICWSAVSTLWAIKPEKSLERIPTAVSLCLLYLAAASVRITREELSWIAFMVVAGGCTASLYSANQYFHGNAMADFEGYRASLVDSTNVADPNFFAASLLLPLSIAFGEVLSCQSGVRRMFMLGATGAIALAVFLTMSRGALLAVLVIACVFFHRLRLNWRLLIPVGVVGATLMVMPNLFFHRFQEAAATRGAGRLDIWEAGISSLGHYGLIGAGLENFGDAYSLYAGSARFFRGFGRAAHNVYLGISVELGILGLVLLAVAIISPLRAVQRLRSSMDHLPPARLVALEAACWAMVTASLFLDLLWCKIFWFSWIMLALAMNASQENRELQQQNLDLGSDYRGEPRPLGWPHG